MKRGSSVWPLAAATAAAAATVTAAVTVTAAGVLSLCVAQILARSVRAALTVAANHGGLDVIDPRLVRRAAAGEEVSEAIAKVTHKNPTVIRFR